jgi:hypothetical protein
VQAGSPDVTGPPVAVGTGVPLTDGGELLAVLPVADPPPAAPPPPAPGDGAETVPHPAASVPAASSGTDASSAARPRCRANLANLANLANPAIPA